MKVKILTKLTAIAALTVSASMTGPITSARAQACQAAQVAGASRFCNGTEDLAVTDGQSNFVRYRLNVNGQQVDVYVNRATNQIVRIDNPGNAQLNFDVGSRVQPQFGGNQAGAGGLQGSQYSIAGQANVAPSGVSTVGGGTAAAAPASAATPAIGGAAGGAGLGGATGLLILGGIAGAAYGLSEILDDDDDAQAGNNQPAASAQ